VNTPAPATYAIKTFQFMEIVTLEVIFTAQVLAKRPRLGHHFLLNYTQLKRRKLETSTFLVRLTSERADRVIS
jgi:hypothetical protein